MHRRELLALLGAGATASLLTPLSASERLELGRSLHRQLDRLPLALTAHERAIVARIADLVLPRTDTPGALDVGVPAFVDALMAGWYSDQERAEFQKGLADLDRRAGTSGFLEATPAGQVELLESVDGRSGPAGSAEAAFTTLKALTIYGYFTSERVQKDVMKTAIIPGRFDGCVPRR
jgi:hypothetical protein